MTDDDTLICPHCQDDVPKSDAGAHLSVCLREARIPPPPAGDEGAPR